jgi:hypothetical protein
MASSNQREQQVGAIEIAKGLQMFPGLPPPPSEDECKLPWRVGLSRVYNATFKWGSGILVTDMRIKASDDWQYFIPTTTEIRG